MRKIIHNIFHFAFFIFLINASTSISFAQLPQKKVILSKGAQRILQNKKILYIERIQYMQEHHNSATLFQSGEINEQKFAPGGAMHIFDVNTRESKTILVAPDGVIRDPDISFDGKKVLFSMRKNIKDFYHIYEMNIDGTDLKQLTSATGVSDIDPIYLPDGNIIFSSTRQPKFCMCNRHIMCNLFRMGGDGSNITQIGVSTLFEGHPNLLDDGRIIYDRWEYVDRNFGDAQGLWVVNPDGTKHAIYYGNNTQCPGGVIDARQIPGTDEVICLFGSCHNRPWGALAILDRKKGVDGPEAVTQIWPKDRRGLIGKGNLDSFTWGTDRFYEDPYPINKDYFLVSRTLWFKLGSLDEVDSKQAIFLMGRNGMEEIIIEGNESLFDPVLVEPRKKPISLPSMRNYSDKYGQFYVENVYEGTHMKGVKKGTAKWLRVVESPEKRTWTIKHWDAQGAEAPAANWHSFENKQILGEVPIEEDGSASFFVPAGKHVFFQLLDENKKMIQSMRSGVSLMPKEINGCIGCHEDRLKSIPMSRKRPLALHKKPIYLNKWLNKEPFKFSFLEHVQPILNKHCVKCHDFDNGDRNKLVLAKDLNPFFNAAYVNIYVNKLVNLVGGGPAEIQQAYSWGSHTSKLTEIIDSNHHNISLNKKEKEILYTWMDLNGPYYPVYESAFDNTIAGRCPLTDEEVKELSDLTGINIFSLNSFRRNLTSQIAFDRPHLSPILDNIRKDKEKYNKAVNIIKIGKRRLKETPRGDIESKTVPCERHKEMLKKYAKRMEIQRIINQKISLGEKVYDKDFK